MDRKFWASVTLTKIGLKWIFLTIWNKTVSVWFSGPFHTTSEKFENWVSITINRTRCFPSTLRLHNNHRSMKVMIEENSGREWIIVMSTLSKSFGVIMLPLSTLSAFSKHFPSTLKWKAGVFKFLRFEERFRNLKAPFSFRITVTLA